MLSTISQPIQVDSRLLHGRRTPLDTFAVVVAVAVSLMFVCVLLAAGGMALEREEHALARLLRGLLSRGALLTEKGLLAAGCSFVVAFAMLAGIERLRRVGLEPCRACGSWRWRSAPSPSVRSGSRSARSLARCARPRCSRSCCRCRWLCSRSCPPARSAHGFYDAIGVVSFVFPFKACLQALDAAVNDASPAIGGSLVHLAGLDRCCSERSRASACGAPT